MVAETAPTLRLSGRGWPRWSAGELERLRLWWLRRVPVVDIAACLGRTVPAVEKRRVLVGLPNRRRTWTRAEDFRLVDLLEEHEDYAAIGRVLGRGADAVRERACRLGVALTRSGGRSISATARLLGVDQKCVAWWVGNGWLRATGPVVRGGRGGGARIRLVEEDDLVGFLSDESLWHLWDPDRIAEAGLRDWALEQRRGVVFLTTGQAGARLCVTHYRVNQMIRQGRLKAVRRGRSNWLVRSDWCVHPPERRSPKGSTLDAEDDQFVRRWWGRVPATWIAWRLGRPSEGAVLAAGKRLGLTPVGRGFWQRGTTGSAEARGVR